MLVDREAASLVHDTFFNASAAELGGIASLTASITFQPVSKDFIQKGTSRGGPNPQGVDVDKAPYFWVVQNLSWQTAEDDAKVRLFAENIAAEMEEALVAKGVSGGYLYMNDAGKGQPVFESYPAANLARLKAIRTKYDPLRIYTNLLTGGWKVLAAGH